MEEELKCPSCKHFYVQPVLLPCFHAVCLACALQNQQAVSVQSTLGDNNGAQSVSELSELSSDCNDSDKLSILSETDSGVVVSSASTASRPSSYIGTNNSTNNSQQSAIFFFSLSCPTCRKIVYFDGNGAQNLPRYRAMQIIVDKFVDTKTVGMICQLCEPGLQCNEASVFCEQCQVFYCDSCRDNCHPARGPLAKHILIAAHQGKIAARSIKDKLKVISNFSRFAINSLV